METNLKKLLPLLGVVCLSMTQAFADDYSSSSTDATCAKMKSAVPPGVNCPCDDGPNVYVNAAYTLWTARQEGLAAGYANNFLTYDLLPDVTLVSPPAAGSTSYPDWKLRSGFKVGLGAYLDHDCWDLGLEYTWFWNKNNGYSGVTSTVDVTYSAVPSTSGAVSPLWQAGAGFTVGSTTLGWDTINSQWNNWFNRIDAELGRAFYVGHYLSFRPFIGLLGAWEEQSFNIQHHSLSTTAGVNVRPDILYTVNNHQKWWGIGPYMGFDTAFIFTNDSCNEWSLFMDSGVALPWGHYQTSSYQTWVQGPGSALPAGLDVVLANNNSSIWNVAPMLELALGLRWETTWSDCNEWSFMLQAAWEEQVWLGHNLMSVLNVGNGGGNSYTMQGLTLKAQLDF